MGGLSEKDCTPCRGGVPPLSEEETGAFLTQINEDWRIVDNHHLTRSWEFPDFASAMSFTNLLGDVCEDQGHHADFELGWGRVVALIYTHKIDGLTESDFVLASKFDDV
ncbi:MAG: pterin-4-alpha-carbinolamine dehydratase [Euryarchaeota archaeon]|mgnify:FL=1|nr:pterin-4-alpha-carbinolamine dehydratase [Euryarchaeota archaeon]|tara:strand:- start:349 stop:675 length:327 start_codon:yes stop_codon:yes gene_type:complete